MRVPRYDFRPLASEFSRAVASELDFKVEARSQRRARRAVGHLNQALHRLASSSSSSSSSSKSSNFSSSNGNAVAASSATAAVAAAAAAAGAAAAASATDDAWSYSGDEAKAFEASVGRCYVPALVGEGPLAGLDWRFRYLTAEVLTMEFCEGFKVKHNVATHACERERAWVPTGLLFRRRVF